MEFFCPYCTEVDRQELLLYFGFVATLSSIILFWNICVLCGQSAWNMIKSGRQNETPLGHVTKDSLSQSLPFLLALSLSLHRLITSLPPSLSFTSSFLSTVPSSFPACSHPSVNPQATGQRTVPEEEECGCCGRWGHIFMKMAEGSAEMRRQDGKESKGLPSSLRTTSETTTIIYFFHIPL